ncbi:glycosyltransferase [Aeromicrobium sp. P5_D10]
MRHLTAPDGTDRDIVRLPDPHPAGRVSAESAWWPPVMLDAEWVRAHAAEFDIFHLHFGFDACAPSELADLVDALRAAGKKFVFTVHDLRNPHHADRRPHDDQLNVLVPAADQLITLTEGAAREIAARWHRHAIVVPHPHVVDPMTASSIRRARESRTGPFRVGVHVKSLRACMDVETILPGLVRAVRDLPNAVLQVNGHRDVLEPDGARFDPHVARTLADLGAAVDLRVHDFLSDTEFWSYLGRLDVSVLPYRHGTHSGWLEACRDLGTQVVAPSCGYYADQGTVHPYLLDSESYDEESLVRAVWQAHNDPVPPVDLRERRRQRDEIAAVHRDLYTRLVQS